LTHKQQKIIDSLTPDIILVDLVMPDMDGFETCIQMKQSDLTKNITIIFVTTKSNTMDKVKLLSGLLPICASCKIIRNDKGYWEQIEKYIHNHSDAKFSHGICPDCLKKLYPDF
jgi:CheY-like chemotaxis protein